MQSSRHKEAKHTTKSSVHYEHHSFIITPLYNVHPNTIWLHAALSVHRRNGAYIMLWANYEPDWFFAKYRLKWCISIIVAIQFINCMQIIDQFVYIRSVINAFRLFSRNWWCLCISDTECLLCIFFLITWSKLSQINKWSR